MNFKKILTGTFLSLVISFVFMCILAIAVHFSNISDRTISAVIFGLSALAVFVGAFVLAKNITCRGLLNGLVLAGLYFSVLTVISVSVNGTVSLCMSNFLRLFATLAAGVLGGVLGINTNTGKTIS